MCEKLYLMHCPSYLRDLETRIRPVSKRLPADNLSVGVDIGAPTLLMHRGSE